MDTIIKGKDGREIDLDKLSPKMRTFYKKVKANLKKYYGINFDDFITSGHRSEDEDKKVGGTGTGRHTKGEGLDIVTTDNPEVYQYLWNTKEGLQLLIDADLGIFDETGGDTGTGAHYHIGADTYKDKTKDNTKRVMKAKTRMNLLKADGAEGIEDAFLTPEEVALRNNIDYLDPQQIIKDIQTKNMTAEQKSLRSRYENLDNVRTQYEDAYAKFKKEVATNEKDKIKKAAKEFIPIWSTFKNYQEKLEFDIRKAQVAKAKEDVKKYVKGSHQYRNAMKVLQDEKNRGGNLKKFYATQPKTMLSLIDAGNQNLNLDKFTTFDDVLNNEFLDKIRDFETGEIDLTNPDIQDQIADETDKRKAEVQTIKDKEGLIVEIEKQKEQKDGDNGGAGDGGYDPDSDTDRAKLEQEALRQAEIAKDHMSRFETDPEEIIAPTPFAYDEKDYKKNPPIEALLYGAMALKGLGDADNEIPLRDEEPSAALINYVDQLKTLSEQGLKPEEEAEFKQQLASFYQQGRDQLVRTSGGNRNIVLGGMDTLNTNMAQGLSKMAQLDAEVRANNLDKYGAMLEKLNAMQMDKKVANHKIKYDEAQAERLAGSTLAANAFKSMAEEIQYQRDRGPGSPYHRLQKAYEVMLTGVDSDREDPGDGSVPYTKSWVYKQRDEAKASRQATIEQNQKERNIYDAFLTAPLEERAKGFHAFRAGYGNAVPTEKVTEEIIPGSRYSPDDNFNQPL